MEIGYSPLSQSEDLMRNVQVNVITSMSMMLDESWRYDLYSPFWRLYLHQHSGAFIELGGKRVDLKPGVLWMIPAWVHFKTGIRKSVAQDYAHFQVVGLPMTILRRFFCCPISLERDEVLEPLCREWKKGINQSANFSHRFWAGALAHAALAEAVGKLSGEEQKQCFQWMMESGDLRPAIDCIERNFSVPPKNAELARLCGTSEDYFIRKFRLSIGMTPAQFGLERRISIAAEWLITTSESLETIAEKAGFTDRFHFSRCFTSRIGFPPATYRRLHRRQN